MNKIKAGIKIMKFILEKRKEGHASFRILTTGSEIVVWGKHPDGRETETIRINY